jgi:tRNA (cytidine/uridine-2'-O-)-methyltransferase
LNGSGQKLKKMQENPLHIVLVEPEIPPNTGSIARLCGATETVLNLVHPLGFSIDDKHVRRAGLDYWPYVAIRNWDSLESFLAAVDERLVYFFTTKVARPYYQARFLPGSYLVFGKETKGLPEETIALYADRCYTIPMNNDRIRSLNLAMCAGIVLYEALRQQHSPEDVTSSC